MKRNIQHFAVPIRIAGISATVGTLCGVTALLFFGGHHLERWAGLPLLYAVRGPMQPPANVIIASLDSEAADALSLPRDPSRWDRAIIARIIERLTAAGVAAIAVDIHFPDAKYPGGDERLTDAIRAAGNVVLFAMVERDLSLNRDPSGTLKIDVERIVPPFPALANVAAATAPFVIPKYGARVDHFWTFHTAADAPSLPVMALATAERETQGAIIESIRKALGDPQMATLALPSNGSLDPASITRLRRALIEQPELTESIQARIRATLPDDGPHSARATALVEAIAGPASHIFSLYGPPRTIRTLSADEILNAERLPDLSDAVVFLGHAEIRQPIQQDGFFTVYTRPDGLDLSGVELAATAYANLAESTALQVPSASKQLAILTVFAILAGMGAALPIYGWAMILVIAGSLGYFALAAWAFEHQSQWLPIMVPLAVQLPITILTAVSLHSSATRRAQSQLRTAMNHYLPPEHIDRVVDNLSFMGTHQQPAFGVCLATDASQYTHLAERLPPGELHTLLNSYYEDIFRPVRLRGGIISDVIGDAMMALWTAPQDTSELQQQAVEAALDILAAVERFQKRFALPVLPTRIGLHAGQMVLGNVGAIDHFEYRAVGDIVNTVARIEQLNKMWHTHILASGIVVGDVDGIITRPLGRFRLRGKSDPVDLFEICMRVGEPGWEKRQQFCESFGHAVTDFLSGDSATAFERFSEIAQTHHADGPTLFYLQYLQGRTWLVEESEHGQEISLAG
ncbi:MAG: adenylate/guanylate cyclase domain-containing protein [Pseudomonadota bacterium]|nr:adenylate/guanylate cyclase domain-containing protein [Pseudomonadota bacterium]